ncbi:IclR family transcriptional regulator [Dactylosporangium sp. NPDC000555]|uniref:IclR family transcriptional regulator n=1 Tax=Dactylosporangium sp. NPDC000555 TaxID=3154260 RepID=UPI00332191CC
MSKQPAENNVADESYRVPAVERAFQILRLIAAQGPLPLTDIVEGTGLNKSTAFYTLRTLVSLDMVLYNEQGRRYELGPGLMELGVAASEEMNDIAVAKRYLAELLERMNVTIVLYRRVNPYQIMLVDKIERVHRVRITLQAGVHVPIQGGSFGRAFLAFDPPKLVDEILKGGLQKFTPRSVTNVREFKRQLAVVREQGWAVDHEGFALGVSTVAAPIFGAEGTTGLVAAAVGFTSVLTDEIAEEYGVLLRETCDRIGRTISGQAVATAATTGQVGSQWKSARQT